MPALKRTWTPHAKQRDILADSTRFRVVAAGRRFGKTELAHHETVGEAWTDPGSYVWWVAPTYGDANELGFDPIERMLPEAVIDGEPKRTAPREIRLVNGSVISFRSGERVDSLRGRGLDFLVIDEAGSVPDRAWKSELRPTLSDTLGSMLAIGTPRGRNWFHEWHMRGQDDGHENTKSWTATTYDNPHVPDSEIEDARSELPERVFAQEYLAEFRADDGAVFGNVRERNVDDYSLDETTGTPPYVVGVDLGRQQNYTGVVVVDSDYRVVHVERIRGMTWSRIADVVQRVGTEYTPNTVYMDATRDNAVIEQLSNERGIYVERVRFTASNKASMIENLAAALELGDLRLPDHETLISELNAFRYDTTPSGNVTYGAPAGVHDDLVDALALATKDGTMESATW